MALSGADQALCVCRHSLIAHNQLDGGTCSFCDCASFRPAALAQVLSRLDAAIVALAQHPDFAGVEIDEVAALDAQGQERRFLDGAVLMKPGDESSIVYLILNGLVHVHRPASGALPELTAQLGPGQLVGEVGVLHGAKHSVTVTALEDLHLLELTRQDLQEAFGGRPKLRDAFFRLMHSRMESPR